MTIVRMRQIVIQTSMKFQMMDSKAVGPPNNPVQPDRVTRLITARLINQQPRQRRANRGR